MESHRMWQRKIATSTTPGGPVSQDPFEQFERSRGGLLIPVALFVIGALMTTVAVGALDDIVGVAVEDPQQEVPAAERVQAPERIEAPKQQEPPAGDQPK